MPSFNRLLNDDSNGLRKIPIIQKVLPYMQITQRIKNIIGQIRLRYLPNQRAQEYSKRYAQCRIAGSAPLLLVQCVEDIYYYALFAEINRSLSAHVPVRTEQLVQRSLREGSSQSIGKLIISRVRRNYFTDKIWMNLYSGFCHDIAYRADKFLNVRDLLDLKNAYYIWKNLHDKTEVINLVIDGIAVGDLIYDSYLRYKPAPTVNIKDGYLFIIIWQSLRDIRHARNYFSQAKPKLFLTSYSSYIHHGIPVRVALTFGVPVYSFGNLQEFAKKLSLQDWVHTASHEQYCANFLNLPEQEQKITQAEKCLKDRMSGIIDPATAYMRRSAYSNINDKVPDVKGALVVFLHDFFDSPHCYQWMLFPDFYEWLVHTIKHAKKHHLKLFIKPHPNELPASKAIVDELKKSYPEVPFLSSSINNKQLIDAGMACGLTVYGTVANELAFLGVPTICCGDHPHISFDFCFTARTLTEYDQLVDRYAVLHCDKALMLKQSAQFYYMHNLNVTKDQVSLLDSVAALRSRIQGNLELPAYDEYEEIVENMISQPEYKNVMQLFINQILAQT